MKYIILVFLLFEFSFSCGYGSVIVRVPEHLDSIFFMTGEVFRIENGDTIIRPPYDSTQEFSTIVDGELVRNPNYISQSEYEALPKVTPAKVYLKVDSKSSLTPKTDSFFVTFYDGGMHMYSNPLRIINDFKVGDKLFIATSNKRYAEFNDSIGLEIPISKARSYSIYQKLFDEEISLYGKLSNNKTIAIFQLTFRLALAKDSQKKQQVLADLLNYKSGTWQYQGTNWEYSYEKILKYFCKDIEESAKADLLKRYKAKWASKQ